MLRDFRLPSLGADMESAVLTEWLVKQDAPIRHGEAIATVETTKGLIDIESYDDGSVAELLVQPGTKVSVGTVLARLNVTGEQAAAVTAPPAPVAVSPAPAAAAAVPSRAPRPGGAPEAHVRVSPAARRRAAELGVSMQALEQLAGGGIIHVEDVERLAAGPAASSTVPAPGTAPAPAAPLDARTAMRAAIGAAMARAKREIPHYYLGQAVDFGPAQAWLTQYNAQVSVQERLIEAVLIIKAVALAAARIEGFNGYFRNGGFERASAVHAGAAIAVRGGGLVAPALLDADRKSLSTLMRDFSALVARVRAGHQRSGEFATATITVTSLGAEGTEVLYPIINPPQVAIVGAGAISQRPWVTDGQLVVRPALTLTLAADHRVTDGRSGSRFLRSIAELLAHPESLREGT